MQEKMDSGLLYIIIVVLLAASLLAWASGSFRQYAVATGSHWVALMTSIVSLAVGIYEKFKGKIDARIFYAVALACFILAGFQAWRDENLRVADLNAKLNAQRNPEFSCGIDQVSDLVNQGGAMGSSVVLLIANVKNTGAESTADSYSLVAQMLDGSVIHGRPLTIPERLPVTYVNGFQRIVSANQALYAKTASPVEHNAFKRGFLMFQLQGLSTEQLEASVKLYVLTFKDIYGKETGCSSRPDYSGPGTTLSFPGLDER